MNRHQVPDDEAPDREAPARPRPAHRAAGRLLWRVVLTVVGVGLCLTGIVLLVLPGPGLLLVLAGLVVLAQEYPWARRLTEPVRVRALRAAEQSVSTRPRIAGSVLCGVALLAAGVVALVARSLPFTGPATGTGLIVSGIALLALLGYSHRRVRRAAP